MWDMQPLTLNVSRSWLESHCALPLRPSSNMVRGKLHSVPQRDLYAQNWIVAASGTPKAAAKLFEEVEALAAKTTRGLQSVSHRKQMSLVLHWHTSVSYAAVYSCLLRSVSEAHWTVTPVEIRPRPQEPTPTPASASSGASGSLAKRERGHESFAQGTSGAAARRLTKVAKAEAAAKGAAGAAAEVATAAAAEVATAAAPEVAADTSMPPASRRTGRAHKAAKPGLGQEMNEMVLPRQTAPKSQAAAPAPHFSQQSTRITLAEVGLLQAAERGLDPWLPWVCARQMRIAGTRTAADFDSRYNFEETIGEGTFSIVRGVRRVADGRLLAAKTMRSNVRAGDVFQEVTLLNMLQHPNIVQLIDVYACNQHNASPVFHLVFEHAGIHLHSYIIEHDISTSVVQQMLAQMCSGLARLHLYDVVHNDLKPASVFVELATLHIRIGDLGAAFMDRAGAGYSPPAGTRIYAAPEALLGCLHYGVAADMWSLGCILGEMVLKKPLFFGQSDEMVINSIFQQLGRPTKGDGLDTMRRLPKWTPHFADSEAQPWPTHMTALLGHYGCQLLGNMLQYSPQSRPCSQRMRMDAFFFPATQIVRTGALQLSSPSRNVSRPTTAAFTPTPPQAATASSGISSNMSVKDILRETEEANNNQIHVAGAPKPHGWSSSISGDDEVSAAVVHSPCVTAFTKCTPFVGERGPCVLNCGELGDSLLAWLRTGFSDCIKSTDFTVDFGGALRSKGQREEQGFKQELSYHTGSKHDRAGTVNGMAAKSAAPPRFRAWVAAWKSANSDAILDLNKQLHTAMLTLTEAERGNNGQFFWSRAQRTGCGSM